MPVWSVVDPGLLGPDSKTPLYLPRAPLTSVWLPPVAVTDVTVVEPEFSPQMLISHEPSVTVVIAVSTPDRTAVLEPVSNGATSSVVVVSTPE